MDRTKSPRLYWANAMFSEADRQFNGQCVAILRQEGYRVFLPQESALNRGTKSPSPLSVFMSDASELRRSDIVVACIDQETIDAGVSAELSLAYAHGISLAVLCTDFRWQREGMGRIYKNLFVLGVVQASGRNFFTSMDGVLEWLHCWNMKPCIHTAEASDGLRPDSGYLTTLQSWYKPLLDTHQVLADRISGCSRILDVGCGPGLLLNALSCQRQQGFSYTGFDIDPASLGTWDDSVLRHLDSRFYTDWSRVLAHSHPDLFDVGVLSFVLHDLPMAERVELLTSVLDVIEKDGRILVLDLFREDLPGLCSFLSRSLARPHSISDPRLSVLDVLNLKEMLGLQVEEIRFHSTSIVFPSPRDTLEYCERFGILNGSDLPLQLEELDASLMSERILGSLEQLPPQFKDTRVFIECCFRRVS